MSLKLHKPTANFPLTSLQCGAILQHLTNAKLVSQGKQLHAHIITSNTLSHNAYLSTKLAASYVNCNSQMHATLHIFKTVNFKSSFLWNSMIRGYVNDGFYVKDLNLYRKLLGLGLRDDKFTFPFVFKACGDLGGGGVISGYASELYVGNCLMYAKFGDMGSVRKVFDGMRVKDLTSWNTTISGCVRNGEFWEMFSIFGVMRRECGVGVDNVSLIGLVSSCGDVKGLREGKVAHGCSVVLGLRCIVVMERVFW